MRKIYRRFLSLCFCVGLLTGFVSSINAAPGNLDPSFGSGGKIITPISANSYSGVKSVAVQPDGKIVVTGDALNFFIVRYNTDGSLDNSFGTSGRVNTPFSTNGDSYSNSLAVQPDGKIVVIGSARVNSKWSFAVARYNSNGTFDNSFGNLGRATLAVSPSEESSDRLYCIAFQNDGKIVLAGLSGSSTLVILRYNAVGTLDTTFGNNGVYTTPLSSFGAQGFPTNELVIQPDGKILVGGLANFNIANGGAVIRLNGDGTPDMNFGSSGILKTEQNIQTFFHQEAIALQPDGKIILAGITLRNQSLPAPFVTRSYFNGEVTLLRYHQNGQIDPTFGNNGVTNLYTSKYSEQINSVVVQTDGKILVCGNISSIIENRFVSPNQQNHDFLVIRFDDKGALDPSWGINGSVTTDFGSRLSEDANDMVIQPDGKIVVAGDNQVNGNPSDFVVARYLNQ